MLRLIQRRWPFAFARMACSVPAETSSSSSEYSSGESSSDNDRKMLKSDKWSITHEDRMEVLAVIKTMSFGGVPYLELSKKRQKKILGMRTKRKMRKLGLKEKRQLLLLQTNQVGVAETLETTPTPNKPSSNRPSTKQQQMERMREALKTGQRLAVDCSMGSYMSPKEITKLGYQISMIYSLLKSSPNPFHLHITDLVKDSGMHDEFRRQCSGLDRYPIDITDQPYHQLFPPNDIIYLTPDSPNALNTLDKSKVYVLGGLVDGSLQVGRTLSKAQELKLETARLPIDLYMERTLPTHCCLAINQVTAILLDIQDGKDWATALETHMPSRKGYILKPMFAKYMRMNNWKLNFFSL